VRRSSTAPLRPCELEAALLCVVPDAEVGGYRRGSARGLLLPLSCADGARARAGPFSLATLRSACDEGRVFDEEDIVVTSGLRTQYNVNKQSSSVRFCRVAAHAPPV
jgi:hypothetical protein